MKIRHENFQFSSALLLLFKYKTLIPETPTYFRYQIVLKIQDFEFPAPPVEVLYSFNVLLMQGHLLQRKYLTIVVLRSASNHLLCD